MPHVRLKQDESFESMWRRFRRSVEKSNLLAIVRKKLHHQKPSQVRKQAKLAAAKRAARTVEKEQKRIESMRSASRSRRDEGDY